MSLRWLKKLLAPDAVKRKVGERKSRPYLRRQLPAWADYRITSDIAKKRVKAVIKKKPLVSKAKVRKVK